MAAIDHMKLIYQLGDLQKIGDYKKLIIIAILIFCELVFQIDGDSLKKKESYGMN